MKNKIIIYLTFFQIFSLSLLLIAKTTLKEQKEIEKMLIAPCCWTSTIDVHPSEISEQMKTEIAQFLKEGKTKDEILKYYVNKYGERILAVPQSPFKKYSVYTFPFIALLCGIIIIIFFLKKSKIPPSEETYSHSRKTDKWSKKLEEELKNWD